MAIRSESADDRLVLRQVVSDIRWLLAHSTGVRADLIRLVRRYEDALYGTSVCGNAGEGRASPTTTTAQILPFRRPRSSGRSAGADEHPA